MTTLTVHVHQIHPPIPTSSFDYSAILDDYDGAPDSPNQPVGYGKTPDLAIEDLIDQTETNPTHLVIHFNGTIMYMRIEQ